MEGRIKAIVSCASVVCLLHLLAVSGMAQDSTRHRNSINLQIGLGAGYALGRLGDFANYGPAATAGLLVRPTAAIPEMSLLMSGSYRYFPKVGTAAGDFSVVTGSLDMRLAPGYENPTHLYLLGGFGLGRVGLAKVRPGKYLVLNKMSQTGPLAEAGVGVEYVSGMRGFFVELRVCNIFSSDFGDYRFAQMTVGALF